MGTFLTNDLPNDAPYYIQFVTRKAESTFAVNDQSKSSNQNRVHRHEKIHIIVRAIHCSLRSETKMDLKLGHLRKSR